jgi:hypothetical protein
MSDSLACVVTTIQPPTPAMRQLAQRLGETGTPLIVIGDKKGPANFDLPGARFVPLSEQLNLPFTLAKLLPTGHYVRKNLGYLLAIASGATSVYETDDDNAPLDSWRPRTLQVQAVNVTTQGWFNVYTRFTDQKIWPRGFPLSRVGSAHRVSAETSLFDSPIQQSLTNDAPDVDALWRLIIRNEPFHFNDAPSVHLAPGTWCPFNSQNTWWFRPAFPLLYLPSTCTFRMTDIWRSLVAQRCLWELNQGVTFHAPDVDQSRNVHDLMKDFEDEIPGYLHNEKIGSLLADTPLTPGPQNVSANLIRCYKALIKAGIFRDTEMQLLRAWVADIEAIK